MAATGRKLDGDWDGPRLAVEKVVLATLSLDSALAKIMRLGTYCLVVLATPSLGRALAKIMRLGWRRVGSGAGSDGTGKKIYEIGFASQRWERCRRRRVLSSPSREQQQWRRWEENAGSRGFTSHVGSSAGDGDARLAPLVKKSGKKYLLCLWFSTEKT